MTGLHAGTIFLLTLWTLWLLAALPLLGRGWKRFVLLAVFVPLALVLAIRTHVTWDSYLITWLAVHTALAAAAAVLNRRRAWVAATSLGGLLWLWGAGGWQYGRYFTTVILIAVAAAALAGLGFGGCWVFVAGPLRKRAGDVGRQAADSARRAEESARQAAAVAGQAARAQRALAKTQRLLAAEQQQRREAEAEITRQDQALQRRLTAEREDLEQERRAWERTGDRSRNALQQAQRSQDLPPRPDSGSGQSEGAADDSDEPAADGPVTLVRLRFSWTAEEPRDDPAARRRAVLLRAAGADPIRLVISRDALTMPRADAGDIDDVLKAGDRARDDPAFRDRFIDAASDYAGSQIGDRTFGVLTQQWQTRDIAGLDAAAQALSRSDEWLHDVAGRPLEGIAGKIGLDGPAGAALGGIGSNVLLAPLDREAQRAVQFCEIVGIGIGLAFGIHMLAIACTKSLIEERFNEALSTAIRKAAENAFPGRDVISATRDREPAVRGRGAAAELREGPVNPIADRGLLDPATLSTLRGQDLLSPRATREARSDLTERRAVRDPVDEPGNGIAEYGAFGW